MFAKVEEKLTSLDFALSAGANLPDPRCGARRAQLRHEGVEGSGESHGVGEAAEGAVDDSAHAHITGRVGCERRNLIIAGCSDQARPDGRAGCRVVGDHQTVGRSAV